MNYKSMVSVALLLAACEKAVEAPKPEASNASPKPHDNAALPLAQTGAVRAIPTSQEQINLSFAPLVKKVAPAVVNIYSTTIIQPEPSQEAPFPFQALQEDPFFKDLHEKMGGDEAELPRQRNSLGSGVIISPQGLVITNLHVIGEDPGEIRVVLSDKREYKAKIVLVDRRTDLAVIQMEGGTETFAHVPLVAQENLEVGDVVLAIGNPFGVGQTVSSGIVSAIDRNQLGMGDFRSFIQTDAAINPGNSGGALITTDGRLVGINTAIYSQSGGSVGIGFAVPTSLVATVVQSALEGKKVERPWMGILVTPVDMEGAQKYKLEHPYGVVVADTYPGGPADVMGLKKGDVILRLNGKEIQDEGNFGFDVGILPVHTQATLQVIRDAKIQNISFELLPPPSNGMDQSIPVKANIPLEGSHLKLLSPAVALDSGVDPWLKGALIDNFNPKSVAKELKFEKGDIIHKVNGIEIKTPEDLNQVMALSSKEWNIVVRRGGKLLTLEVKGQ